MGSMDPIDPRAQSAAIARELGWTRVNDKGYEILEEAYGSHASKRMIVIGAGATGICLAKFAEVIPNLELQVYEKNDEIAGTWWENRYPGCACDIPAHIYQFLWALNPDWSHYYVSAEEILRYFQKTVDDHGLRKYIKLQQEVIKASWDSALSKWKVQLKSSDGIISVDTCDFLVNGSGLLNHWKWPDIKGLQTFKGRVTHSASYDTTIDLKGKKVVVFGAGSSAVQIVAKIQEEVDHLHTWIRSPIWISSGFASSYAGPNGANFAYSESLKNVFKSDPKVHLRYVKMLEAELSKRFDFNLVNTKQAQDAIIYSKKQMEEKLHTRPELAEKIIPKTYGIGCRRPTPGNGYLEALVAENVTVHTQEVREITPTGFIDNAGVEHPLDIIICATGFDTSYVPRFPVLANGKDLREVWKSDPVAYFSVMVPDFPNYFLSLGPYSAANGSLLPVIEFGAHYMLKIVEKCQLELIKAISPKVKATKDFQEHSDLLLKRMVWNQPCRSWYKGGTVDGLPRMYPGSRAHFVQIMQPRYEDFELTYEKDNEFFFMGNGFSTREIDGSDATWYFGLVDGEDKEPDYTEDEERIFVLSGTGKQTA